MHGETTTSPGVPSDVGAESTTSRETFTSLAAEHRVVPVIRKVLADSETPLSAYRKLGGDRPGTFLLESAENGRSWSRWSFIGAGTPAALTTSDGEAVWRGNVPAGVPSGGDPLEVLGRTVESISGARELVADRHGWRVASRPLGGRSSCCIPSGSPGCHR